MSLKTLPELCREASGGKLSPLRDLLRFLRKEKVRGIGRYCCRPLETTLPTQRSVGAEPAGKSNPPRWRGMKGKDVLLLGSSRARKVCRLFGALVTSAQLCWVKDRVSLSLCSLTTRAASEREERVVLVCSRRLACGLDFPCHTRLKCKTKCRCAISVSQCL